MSNETMGTADTSQLESGARYLQFSLGTERFAMPLLRVREVIAPPEVTPIPQTPGYVQGIMNLRGQVITVIDLRAKLGIKPLDNNEKAVIITNFDGLSIGVTVDSIDSVIAPKAEETEGKLGTWTGKAAEYVSAVFRCQEGLVLLLDLARVLSFEDRNSIAASQMKKGA